MDPRTNSYSQEPHHRPSYSMSALDLIRGEAELDEEEADESFDEETGEVRRKASGLNGANHHLDDSSEEEEDDEDEEAAREVCNTHSNFIADNLLMF